MLEDDSVLRCSSAGIVGQTFVGQHGCAAAMHTSHLVWLLACGAAIQSFRRRSSLVVFRPSTHEGHAEDRARARRE